MGGIVTDVWNFIENLRKERKRTGTENKIKNEKKEYYKNLYIDTRNQFLGKLNDSSLVDNKEIHAKKTEERFKRITKF